LIAGDAVGGGGSLGVAWVFLRDLATEGVVAVEGRVDVAGLLLSHKATGVINADEFINAKGAQARFLKSSASISKSPIRSDFMTFISHHRPIRQSKNYSNHFSDILTLLPSMT
jgi:glycine/D-amino acid oxidase-like deaminating enzyme